MSYIVNFSNESKNPLIVEDGAVNSTTDMSLVGRSVSGYGKYIAQNFLNILENFSSSTPPPRPIQGQLWFDTSIDKLKVYTTNNIWKAVDGIDLSESKPSTNDSNDGDFWFDTNSSTFYIFYNNDWIPLVDSDSSNRIISKTRYDSSNVPRKTLECVVNNNVVFVVSSEMTEWTPKSSGENQERLPNGSLMAFEYPNIKRGINLNSLSDYTINNFNITELNDLFINVGRGKVFLENNIYEGDGSGITFRTNSNPTGGSIFSIRNRENDSKLWVGNSLTTPGNNSFAVGNPQKGAEPDEENYNIILDKDGNISAKTISGEWVATENEAIARQITNKVITPFSGGRIANTSINERLSSYDTAINGTNNVELMTPLLTRQAIDHRLSNLNLDEIVVDGGTSNSGGTILSSQVFSSPSLLIYDRVSSGSDEIKLTQNTWNTVPLNSIEFNSVPVEVSSNSVNIPEGNHYIEWQAVVKSQNDLDVTNLVTRIYDVTNNETLINGQSITISNNQSIVLSGYGVVDTSTSINIELQVFANQDDVYFRYGDTPSDTDEVYSVIKAFSIQDQDDSSSSPSSAETPEYDSNNAYIFHKSIQSIISPTSTIASENFNREVTFSLSSQDGQSSKITFVGNGESVYGSADNLASGNFPLNATTGGTVITSVNTEGIFMLPAGVRVDFESFGSGGVEGSGPGLIQYTARPVL